MTPADLANKSFEYIGFFGPVLLLFIVLAFAEKIIDIIVGIFRRG